MTRKFEVIIQPPARDALREAFRHIEEKDGHGRAANWLAGMRSAIEGLERKPTIYAPVQLRQGRVIRSKLSMKRYRVYFIVDEKRRVVDVIDVVHTARQIKLSEYRSEQ